MASKRRIFLLALLASAVLAGGVRAQTPPSSLDQYVLFGSDKLAGKNVLVTSGAIGSDHAVTLQSQSAYSSDIVGSLVRLSTGSFSLVYSRALLGVDSVVDLQRWVPINDGLSFRDSLGLFDDLGGACNFPVPPTCSGPNITVPEGITVTVPAGVYGDLRIQGGLDPVTSQPMPGGVILPGGTYTFCNVQVASRGTILVQSQSDIRIAGNLKLARGAYLGPASTSTITSSAIGVFVGGTRVKFGGSSSVFARTCAPYAQCGVAGGDHAGALWCDSLRVRNTRFSPVSAPGCTVVCDDGNDCTSDVCSGTACFNIPQNGTSCLIGGVTPGGICSQGTCLASPTTTIPPATTTSSSSSTSTTSSSSTSSTLILATTTTSTVPPATTTSTTAPPGTTTSTTAPPGTTTSTTAPPATTTSTTAPPATTTSTTAPPATTTSTTAPPATTTSTTAPPATTTSTTTAPPTTTSTTLFSPSGAFID